MFISIKRHERERQELLGANHRLTEAILKTAAQGLFLLDGRDKIVPPVSHSLAGLFRRQDFNNLTFEKLLAPIVTAKTLTVARAHLTALRAAGAPDAPAVNPLRDIDVRLANADGSFDAAHFSFEFDPVFVPNETRAWLVRVTDITARVQTDRDLAELRGQHHTQGDILRGVLHTGGARFGGFLRSTGIAMTTIAALLKKPAREQAAFRAKLDEILDEVERVRREAAVFKLTALESTARNFEEAVHELRNRGTLSGGDFLPLAVKLDQLFNQVASVKSLTLAASPGRDSAAGAPAARTRGVAQLIKAGEFTGEMAESRRSAATHEASAAGSVAATHEPSPVGSLAATQGSPAGTLAAAQGTPPGTLAAARGSRAGGVAVTHQPSPAGTLAAALETLADHVAQEQNKQVALASFGLHSVPPNYRAAVENVAVQLIRNAVMHGIEAPSVREASGKAVRGTLRLDFRVRENDCELLFEDDGCGLDPQQVRETAVACGIVTAAAAGEIRDREVIKLIFKSRYTTLPSSAGEVRHGAGMSLVRRYVHEAGGKIALASVPGYETRFKITLPTAAGDATAPDSKAAEEPTRGQPPADARVA